MQLNPIYLVMGVSGSGKTTVGELLAERIDLPFHDADDFHSQANKKKMKSGIPLTDDDRKEWLADMAASISEWETNGGAVLACSALKEAYRQVLQGGSQQPIRWIFLDGSRELLSERISARKGHYMGVAMLDSQLTTLEKPTYGLRIELLPDQKPAAVVDRIMQTDVTEETNPALSVK